MTAMLERVLGWQRLQRLRQAVGMKPQPKACCRDVSNLGAPVQQTPGKDDLVYRQCRACGCRHFELTVDAGHLGVKGLST